MRGRYPFQAMAKPAGSNCNLHYSYCYYLDKSLGRMSGDLLEEYIHQYIESQPGPAITFHWQRREPTLAGLDFFENAVKIQKRKSYQGWSVEKKDFRPMASC